jgi:16S rRNA (cytidine1402-2'-O)-methyltransferase
MAGKLYIVPTPIGNLEDITLRALEILKSVDCIYCEDTTVTQKLLKKYDITNKTSVFYAQSGKHKIEEIIKRLVDGENLALVSDAGTPGISDPGTIVVDAVRKAFTENQVVVLPGASALITALVSFGLPVNEFTFFGFIPHKKGRETLFKTIAEERRVSVCYESVHRIEKTLESLSELLDDTRMVVVARELSKLHEEVVRGNAKEVQAYFKEYPDKVRGEFVLLIASA